MAAVSKAILHGSLGRDSEIRYITGVLTQGDALFALGILPKSARQVSQPPLQ
jgi:hypothetical protein